MYSIENSCLPSEFCIQLRKSCLSLHGTGLFANVVTTNIKTTGIDFLVPLANIGPRKTDYLPTSARISSDNRCFNLEICGLGGCFYEAGKTSKGFSFNCLLQGPCRLFSFTPKPSGLPGGKIRKTVTE